MLGNDMFCDLFGDIFHAFGTYQYNTRIKLVGKYFNHFGADYRDHTFCGFAQES